MAIAFDNKGTSTTNDTSDTFSVIGTVNSNTNGVIVGFFGLAQGGSVQSSPTYNGSSMTKIGNIQNGANDSLDVWYYKAPPTGAGTILGTWSIINQPRFNCFLSYTGVDQTTPIAGSALGTDDGNGTAGTITLAISANDWFVGAAQISNIPGTIVTGIGRGTISDLFQNLIPGDNTSGTLAWRSPGAFDAYSMGGVRLTAAAGGGGGATNRTFKTLTGAGNI